VPELDIALLAFGNGEIRCHHEGIRPSPEPDIVLFRCADQFGHHQGRQIGREITHKIHLAGADHVELCFDRGFHPGGDIAHHPFRGKGHLGDLAKLGVARIVMINKHQRRRFGFFLHDVARRKNVSAAADFLHVGVPQHDPGRERLVHSRDRAGRVVFKAELDGFVAQVIVIGIRIRHDIRGIEIADMEIIGNIWFGSGECHEFFFRAHRPSLALATGMNAAGLACAGICCFCFIVSLGSFRHMVDSLRAGLMDYRCLKPDPTSLIVELVTKNRRSNGHLEAQTGE